MTFVEGLGVVVTLVVLEAVLSFDNAAILTVMSRMVPDARDRKRALNYGLAIAYVLRVGAILGAVFLIQHPTFRLVGGVYLLFLSGRHFWQVARARQQEHSVLPARMREGHRPWLSSVGLSPFAAIIVQIGVIDLIFALDQVVAAVGFTQEIPKIILAAGIGLLSLRLLSPLISRLMDWLPVLEHMAFVAVAFVGAVLVLAVPPFNFDVAQWIKVGVTLGLFALPVAWKLAGKAAPPDEP